MYHSYKRTYRTREHTEHSATVGIVQPNTLNPERVKHVKLCDFTFLTDSEKFTVQSVLMANAERNKLCW